MEEDDLVRLPAGERLQSLDSPFGEFRSVNRTKNSHVHSYHHAPGLLDALAGSCSLFTIHSLLATSVCGHGLFASDPWSLGICGGFSSPIADELIAQSDLILGFGVSFTQWTTKRGKLIAEDAVVAQIDIEPTRIYRLEDAKGFLSEAGIATESLPDLGVGLEWHTSYLPHEVVLSISSAVAFAAADFNANEQLAKLVGERGFRALAPKGANSSVHVADVAGRAVVVTLYGPAAPPGLVRELAHEASRVVAVALERMLERGRAEAEQRKPLLADADEEIDRLFDW